jgi:uncharacterized integral membrane protein
MARKDQPARNTTADPTVPGQRQQTDEQHAVEQYGGAQNGGAQYGGEEPATEPLDRPQGAQPPEQRPGSAAHPLERTRLSGAWVAIGCFVVVLLFLLFFILANNQDVRITIFGQHVHLPLGVAMVFSALCGALLVLFAGIARITQMRSRVRKHRRAAHKASKRDAAA